MRNTILLLSLCLMVVATAGCKCGYQKTQNQDAATAEAYPSLKVPPESEWTSGEVLETWPFKNGEVLVYLGTRNGITNGETLLLKRGSVTINTIDVVDAKECIFYGRVHDRTDPGRQPKVGDMAVKIPTGK